MRIKKAKVTSDKKIMMIYEKENKNGNWDEYQFTCSDQARPEFYTAIQNLASHVLAMCELPENYLNRIEVRGVSFSYSGPDETMGATISAGMQLDNSYVKLNLNTPHKASDSYTDQEADPMQVLSVECIEDLDKLCAECQLYIDGDRAQGKLF